MTTSQHTFRSLLKKFGDHAPAGELNIKGECIDERRKRVWPMMIVPLSET